jgi:hypothetical protein
MSVEVAKLKELKEPFKACDIEWRVSRSGVKNGKPWAMVLAYINNRAVMDRLDDVCEPWNWQNEYKPLPSGGMICGVSIKVGDEWINKWDGSDNTKVEATKGGLSGSMKRAVVQWGIGRYLYNLTETSAIIVENGEYSSKVKDKQYGQDVWFNWNPPQLPPWALPAVPKKEKVVASTAIIELREKATAIYSQIANPPQNLTAWIKYIEYKDIKQLTEGISKINKILDGEQ